MRYILNLSDDQIIKSVVGNDDKEEEVENTFLL